MTPQVIVATAGAAAVAVVTVLVRWAGWRLKRDTNRQYPGLLR